MYYRSARVAICVYDITSRASLDKAKNWIRDLRRSADPNVLICLAGNKTDLEENREVTKEEASKYAEEEGLIWKETSAKTGEGIADMFATIGSSSCPGAAHPLTKLTRQRQRGVFPWTVFLILHRPVVVGLEST
jgi:Ras-related protein Rab-5C